MLINSKLLKIKFSFYYRSLATANPSRRAEIIDQVPRDTYLIPKTEQRPDSPLQANPLTQPRSVQSYLGTDQLRLQTFNVQVNQSKEEITVDDSFEDRVSSQ